MEVVFINPAKDKIIKLLQDYFSLKNNPAEILGGALRDFLESEIRKLKGVYLQGFMDIYDDWSVYTVIPYKENLDFNGCFKDLYEQYVDSLWYCT